MLRIFLILFALGMVHCGGTLDPCVKTECPEGQACIVIDSQAICQTPGDGDGDGDGMTGDVCESDEDCAVPLTCTAVEGVLECM